MSGTHGRGKYFAFLDENPGATFHHATAHDGVQFVYCKAQDKGIWFLPKKAWDRCSREGGRF